MELHGWIRLLSLAIVLLALAPSGARAAIYTVNDTGVDSGSCDPGDPCTLNDAITAANDDDASVDTIAFDIGLPDTPATIATGGTLSITGPVTIDGRTQFEASPNPPVDIDAASGGFAVLSPDVTFRGLVIRNRTANAAIEVFGQGDRMTVEDCYLGTTQDGLTADPNRHGIRTQSGRVEDLTIGGPAPAQRNVISGNTLAGLVLANAYPAVVRGNFIGTDVTGSAALPNGSGIDWTGNANGSIIGGDAASPGTGAGNVISGNTGVGVTAQVFGGGEDFGGFENNLVGVAADGTTPLGNGGDGLVVTDAADASGFVNQLHIGAFNDRIVAHEPNVFGANGGVGVRLQGLATMGNAHIGVGFDGTTPLGNAGGGVVVEYPDQPGQDFILGGFSGFGFEQNVISANGGPGVEFTSAATGVNLQGARIGMTRDGTAALPNDGPQVLVDGAGGVHVQSNRIGGGATAPGGPADGVRLSNATGTIVSGSQIGVNDPVAAGALAPLANDVGIAVDGASTGTFIGPLGDDQRANTISGNATGISIGPAATDTTIRGNRIGVGPDEDGESDPLTASPLPNATDGITVEGDSVRIGTTDAGSGNRIATNGDDGVEVLAAADDVGILGNSLEGNTGDGIAIDPAANSGLTPAPPSIDDTTAAGGNVRVHGDVTGTAGTYRVEAFRNAGADCEGRQLIGADTVEVSGPTEYDVAGTVSGAAAGDDISVTATLLEPATEQRTSEMSACTAAGDGADLTVTQAVSDTSITRGEDVTYTVSVANAGGGPNADGVELRNTLPSGVTVVSAPASCSVAGGVATCPLGTLAPGASAQRAFTVRPTSNGTRTNTASVTSDEADPTNGDRSSSRSVGVTAPAGAQPAAAQPAASAQTPDASAAPAPVVRQAPPSGEVRAEVVEGVVTITLPDGRVVSPADLTAIPLGSTIDATNGAIRLVSPEGGDMVFRDGVFVLGRAPDGTVELKLQGAIGPCPAARTPRAAQQGKSRKLWGKGKGNFRVTGKHSAAVVRGTDFTVTDACDGTLTETREGEVLARDFAIGREVRVRAGGRYLAKNLPLPQRGRTVNLVPGGKNASVRLNGRTVRIGAFRHVPVGATVDATSGGVRLVSAGADVTQFATFTEGAFRITGQQGTLLALSLADPPRAARRARASARKSKRLWGDGKGSFKVSGKHSAAVVRGTRWLVEERSDGTLTRVAEGVVAVEDFKRRRTVTVRAGGQYLARR